MRKLLFVGFLFITSMAFGQVAEVKNEYGEVSYKTGLFSLRSERNLETRGTLVYTEDEILGFSIHIYSGEILHLNEDFVSFFIDGERRQFEVYSREREYDPTGRTLTVLKLNLIIDSSLLHSIAEAEKARFTIGVNAYEFSPSAKINVLSMLDKIQEIKQK